MKTSVALLALVMVGCSIPRAPDSTDFFQREAAIVNECIAPIKGMGREVVYRVDPATGSSPTTNSVQCYASKVRWMVATINYPHAYQVDRFASLLLETAQMRDKGVIDTPTALATFQSAKAQFKQSIADADEQINAAGRMELVRRLGNFAGSMSALGY